MIKNDDYSSLSNMHRAMHQIRKREPKYAVPWLTMVQRGSIQRLGEESKSKSDSQNKPANQQEEDGR